MKPKTLRHLAGVALVPLAFEALPHAVEPEDDCVANVMINLCSGSVDPWAVEPWNVHVPHEGFETTFGQGYGGWIASGEAVASTSTGPSHRMMPAGENAAGRFIK